MIKVRLETISKNEEEEIVIKTHTITDEVLSIMKKLQEQSSGNASLIGQKEDKIYSVKFSDILYIEATENKTFVYSESDFYESRLKLYEIEEQLTGHSFFRCSKSVIMNSSKIDCVKPAFNGRFEARMINGEKIIISRQYVPELKKILGI